MPVHPAIPRKFLPGCVAPPTRVAHAHRVGDGDVGAVLNTLRRHDDAGALPG